MGKLKSTNPADAYRKAQRKKELAKNKETRKKTRELVNVKKDTAPFEEEIREIQAKPTLDGKDKTRLANLRAELEKLRKAKEEYVKEHPEHRRLVYGESSAKQSRESDVGGNKPAGGAVRQVFGKDGLPLYPERSIYYDPVLNRYGVPPPGMPYMEKPMPPDVMEEDDDLEESDDDVLMPEGPAPNADMSDSDDSDDEIPMPTGPPPPRNAPPLPKGPPPLQALPPLPPISMDFPPGFSPLPMEYPVELVGLPFPPPPPGFAAIPPPPPGFSVPAPIPANFPSGAIPGPPMGLPPFPPNLPPPPPPPTNSRSRPHNPRYRGPPPGVYDPMTPFFPQVVPPLPPPPPPSQSTSRLPPPPPHLPPRPPPPLLPTSTTAVISAEPELRDFKKEATSFVPRQAKKPAKGNSRVNATPDTGDSTPAEARPDLMKSLEEAGVSVPKQQATGMSQKKANTKVEAKDDYDKFMDDMGDFLKQ